MTILKKIEISRHTCIRYFIVVVNPSSMFNQSFGVSGWLVSDLLSSFVRQLGSEPKILHLDCSQILLNFLVASANVPTSSTHNFVSVESENYGRTLASQLGFLTASLWGQES